MNVKMNGNLFSQDWIDRVYVFPIASDAGTSIGAGMAFQYAKDVFFAPRTVQHVYLGNSYSDQEIEETLIKCKLPYIKVPSLEAYVAEKISTGKIVGWFQVGMEGGQRALGARSILADPRREESRDVVNAVIKYRQPWRPFCPSLLEEFVTRYFIHGAKIVKNGEYPLFVYMTMALGANELAKEEIPAVVHVDGTSRLQIVKPYGNPRYYRLIEAFRDITGIGALLNTSFNIKGEPIICTPADAIRTFYATGLDLLVIGDCILEKGNGHPIHGFPVPTYTGAG